MILITGASRGIGKFLFEKFEQAGEKVYGTFYQSNPVAGKEEYYSKVDIRDISSIRKWLESIKDLSNITLINCAGNNYAAFAHKSDNDKWKEVIDVNLTGTFNVISKVLPFMREQNYGRIINLSSVVAQIHTPGASAYAASKSGLWGMVKSIAVENSKFNITINNLNLGYYDIGMISEVTEEYQKMIKEKIPTHNFGNPENIYRAVKFIIDSDYTTGTSIDMNGGLF